MSTGEEARIMKNVGKRRSLEGGVGVENEQSLERREMVLIVVFGNLPTLPNNLTSWSHSVLPASGRILY
jgi:hypothetical protein